MAFRFSFHNFRRHEDGLAALEFALIAPLLVLLFFGAVELSNLLIADSRMRTVAASIADLLAQKSNGIISQTDLNVANTAATQIMLPLSVNGRLAVLLTVWRPATLNTSQVVWTRIIKGGTTGSMLGSELGLSTPACATDGLPASLLPKSASSPFNDVLQVTAVYEFHPWFATIFSGSFRVTSGNYNMPRYTLTLDPGNTLSPPCS